jgi:4,5-DOPA dioxygenase extradiol
LRFENKIRESILNRDDKLIVEYDKLVQDAMMSVPTPDHYLPLLYVIASREDNDQVSFPVQGFDGGSVSMLAVRFG